MTERLHFHSSLSCIEEENGNPLQCSCLENLRDGGAWWAAIYGVAQSRIRLKRLRSSSSMPYLPFSIWLTSLSMTISRSIYVAASEFLFSFLWLSKWSRASQVEHLVKNFPANVGDLGSIPRSGRSPGEGQDNPTPVFLPGGSQGRGSLVGCQLWGCTESDMTEAT